MKTALNVRHSGRFLVKLNLSNYDVVNTRVKLFIKFEVHYQAEKLCDRADYKNVLIILCVSVLFRNAFKIRFANFTEFSDCCIKLYILRLFCTVLKFYCTVNYFVFEQFINT